MMIAFLVALTLFVIPLKVNAVTVTPLSEPYVVVVDKAFNLSIKDTTSTSGSTVATVKFGQPLIVVGKSSDNSWLEINLYVNGTLKSGYIQSSKISEYVYDESFESQISNFPETYKQKLRYLHVAYPNWKFYILNTGVSFETAAAKYQSSALIDTSESSMIASSTILEGSTWRRASLAATKYFLDPRNYLQAYYAMAFNKLSYNSSEVEADAESMVKSTFMNSTESISGKSWATLLTTYANKYDVSLFNVVTRALQEQGTSGGIGASGGTATADTSGTKYYNVFNIGANSGAQDGIDYAKSNGWDTVEKSIDGGIAYLASKYVKTGQWSLYLQRFNVNPASSYPIYTHSYMTNVRAPYYEAMKLITAYCNSENHLDEKIQSLYIPVYTDMADAYSYPDTSSTSYFMGVSQNLTTFTNINDTSASYTEKFAYTGSSITPNVTLVDSSGTTLRKNIDYALTYSNNTSEGTATITVHGLNQYTGEKTLKFTIGDAEKKSVTALTVASVAAKTYTGSSIKPSLTVKNGSTTLKSGTDYSTSYSSNTNPGVAKATITGKGNYTSSRTVNFNIKPKTNKLTSAKSTGKKKLYVKYSSSTGVSGYQIAYRKSTTSAWSYKTTSSKSKTITGLSRKKYYYVKVRSYKNSGSTRIYSNYSSTKKVKIK